jgi:hypothetical protein
MPVEGDVVAFRPLLNAVTPLLVSACSSSPALMTFGSVDAIAANAAGMIEIGAALPQQLSLR